MLQMDKILDPAWATLLQCEPATRYGVITIFLRATLIGLENVIAKFAPRTLTHPVAVQIVTDLGYIRGWATQAEETLRSIERDEPTTSPDDVINDAPEDGDVMERERRPSHPLQGTSEPLAFRMTNINSSKDISPSSLLTSSGSNKSTSGRPKEAALPKRDKCQLLADRDFQRWTCIAEILTAHTNSERVMTNDDVENSPLPDAAKWAALCKR